MDSTNAGTGKEGDGSLGNHGQVDNDSVTLLDTELLEHVGSLRNSALELNIGDLLVLVGLVCLVDDGDPVGVLVRPSVNAVVRGVQLTLAEPSNVAVDKATALDGLERNIPVDDLTSSLKLDRRRRKMLVNNSR